MSGTAAERDRKVGGSGRRGHRGPGWQTLRRRLLASAAVGALLGSLGVLPAAPVAAAASTAPTVITDCTYGSLSAAIPTGSATAVVDLECSAGTSTIPFTGPLGIASGVDVTIEVPSGYSVTLGGSSNTVQLFTVASGGSLTLQGTGGASPSLTLSYGNAGASANGGAVDSSGSLTASGVLFEHDSANLGGAVANESGATLTVSDSVFYDNKALYSSGVAGGAIYDDGTMTVTQSTFSDNTSACGGAIGQDRSAATATIVASSFASNTETAAGNGGGAINTWGQALTVVDSTFTGNTASGEGGAISAGAGGGTPALTVAGSTFSGNQATGSSAGNGGAVFDGAGSLTMRNSTLTGNSAGKGGGGLYLSGAPASIVGSTVYANTAPTNAGGDLYTAGRTTLTNDILAGTTAAEGNDCSVGAAITDDGYNLGSDTSCAFGGAHSQNGAQVLLGPLQANGGPVAGAPGWTGTGATGTVETMALQGTSATDAAVGGGSPTACSAAPPSGSGGFDQRGVVRSAQPGSCDVGAYELTAPPSSNPEIPAYSFSPSPIASTGSLNAGQTVAVVVYVATYQGAAVPFAPLYLSLNPGTLGTATAGGSALGTSPTGVTADASGRVAVDYVSAATLPAAGGTDTLTAQDAASSPALTASDTYAYAVVAVGGGGGGGGYIATAPLVTGISPSGGPAAGGTTVTISGTGFTGATAVDFGANAATDVTVESDTQIQASSPAGTGTVDVTVSTPAGTSATSTADRFAYAAATPPAKASTFSDVPSSYWAYAAIEQLAGKGIVGGFPNGTFQPNGDVTRAQFVKMLVLTLGLKPSTGTLSFGDVPAGAWFAPYVSAAVQAGIVDGVSATRFDPNGTLTREEMAVLLARALKLTKTAALHFSDDATIGAWATGGVREAVAAGYIDGFPDGSFQPLATATRAQAAKVLAMVLATGS